MTSPSPRGRFPGVRPAVNPPRALCARPAPAPPALRPRPAAVTAVVPVPARHGPIRLRRWLRQPPPNLTRAWIAAALSGAVPDRPRDQDDADDHIR